MHPFHQISHRHFPLARAQNLHHRLILLRSLSLQRIQSQIRQFRILPQTTQPQELLEFGTVILFQLLLHHHQTPQIQRLHIFQHILYRQLLMNLIQRYPVFLPQQFQNLPLHLLNIHLADSFQIRIRMQQNLGLTLQSIPRRQCRSHHLAHVTQIIIRYPLPKLQLLVIHYRRFIQNIQQVRCLISLWWEIAERQNNPCVNLLWPKLNRHPQPLMNPIIPVVRNPIGIGLRNWHWHQYMGKKGLQFRHYRKLQIFSGPGRFLLQYDAQ